MLKVPQANQPLARRRTWPCGRGLSAGLLPPTRGSSPRKWDSGCSEVKSTHDRDYFGEALPGQRNKSVLSEPGPGSRAGSFDSKHTRGCRESNCLGRPAADRAALLHAAKVSFKAIIKFI